MMSFFVFLLCFESGCKDGLKVFAEEVAVGRILDMVITK